MGKFEKPDGVSEEGWSLYLNQVAQGKDSDPFYAERTVQSVKSSLASHDFEVYTAKENIRIENQRLDDFQFQHPDDGCGFSGYDETKHNEKQTVLPRRSNGFVFFIICILAFLVGGFLKIIF